MPRKRQCSEEMARKIVALLMSSERKTSMLQKRRRNRDAKVPRKKPAANQEYAS